MMRNAWLGALRGKMQQTDFFVSCFVRQSREESTNLGKRSRPSVNPGIDGGETGERGEGIIHTEKSTDRQKRKRPKKKKEGFCVP